MILSQCPSAYCYCSVTIQLRHHFSRRQTTAKPGSLLCLALMVPYSYEAGRNQLGRPQLAALRGSPCESCAKSRTC